MADVTLPVVAAAVIAAVVTVVVVVVVVDDELLPDLPMVELFARFANGGR